MTAIRSARSAATSRSWVTNRTSVPCSCARAPMRSRICRWTVVSRALVGSSARSRRGRASVAMAMRT
ncbi:hypothetical protein DY245_31745 [Streptomyces inhibens]|uniref:Uncharacterized protein n=1 Tax=Streptomyces inhibens TaxID=2293571 RepID=A0A371PVM7_STRIH|nr:hypothetical protein DY245_31745 [Streptomyces inhibens]